MIIITLFIIVIVCDNNRLIIDLTDIDSQVSKLFHHAAYHEQRTYLIQTQQQQVLGPSAGTYYMYMVYEAHAQNSFYYSEMAATSAAFGLLAVSVLLQSNIPIQVVY